VLVVARGVRLAAVLFEAVAVAITRIAVPERAHAGDAAPLRVRELARPAARVGARDVDGSVGSVGGGRVDRRGSAIWRLGLVVVDVQGSAAAPTSRESKQYGEDDVRKRGPRGEALHK
jgi:hypothetical protein